MTAENGVHIADSHVHVFPYMGAASGFPDSNDHLRRIQRGLCSAINPARSKKDDRILSGAGLWNGRDPSPSGLSDVSIRPAAFGRFEWTLADGEDAYLQYFAPSLTDNTSSPEYVIAEMDYAGVTTAVLQNHPIYGHLNDFIADCVRNYPKRFIGLAHVNENLANTDAQLAELTRCAAILGLRGLMYEVGGFWEDRYRNAADDSKYEPFWDEVERSGMVVFWDAAPSAFPSASAYTTELERMWRVLERHARIRTVLVQAFPIDYYASDGRYRLPDVANRLAELPGFNLEIAYPISYGTRWDYPYEKLWPLVSDLRDVFGAGRLVCGSDMPNVLRTCTYRQSYSYLTYCKSLSSAELQSVLGANLLRIFEQR